MEGTENFHKTCAPVNVQAKEIHFAVAIGAIQFIRQVSVFCYLLRTCYDLFNKFASVFHAYVLLLIMNSRGDNRLKWFWS